VHALRRRLVHVAGADRGDDRQTGHGVERGADHAAMQALVGRVAEELWPHRQAAVDAPRPDRDDAQAEHLVEGDGLLEQCAQRFDVFGLEDDGLRHGSLKVRAGGRPAPS
jgi:hypothetical protein